jgi:hypothetical protein
MGALVLALGLVLLPAPASAATTVVDPAGDGIGVGDVRAMRVVQNDDLEVVFQVRLNAPTHPARATWIGEDSRTSMRINIDEDGDAGIESYIIVEAEPGAAQLHIVNLFATPEPRGDCGLSLDFPQQQRRILRFRLSHPDCLGTPAPEAIRAFVRFRFDQGGNGSIDSADRAPNGGWSASVPLDETN